jgi:hypothetical protein
MVFKVLWECCKLEIVIGTGVSFPDCPNVLKWNDALPQKLQLTMNHDAAADVYSDTVKVWIAKVNAGGSEELQSLHAVAKEARYSAEDARYDLEKPTLPTTAAKPQPVPHPHPLPF